MFTYRIYGHKLIVLIRINLNSIPRLGVLLSNRTLRPDDDTGRAYTQSFLEGSIMCEKARLLDAQLYTLGPYPYLMFSGPDKKSMCKDTNQHDQRREGEEDGRNVVWGRLISFPAGPIAEKKLRMADEIEGYLEETARPEDEDGYYRKVVNVEVFGGSAAAAVSSNSRFQRAHVYFRKAHPDWISSIQRINSGDWMKRAR